MADASRGFNFNLIRIPAQTIQNDMPTPHITIPPTTTNHQPPTANRQLPITNHQSADTPFLQGMEATSWKTD
jgi:hypothetical protein